MVAMLVSLRYISKSFRNIVSAGGRKGRPKRRKEGNPGEAAPLDSSRPSSGQMSRGRSLEPDWGLAEGGIPFKAWRAG